MDKQTAINLLGGTPKKAAAAMGYKSPHAIYMWPDILTTDVAQRVHGVLSMRKKPRKARASAPAEAKAA
jgi:hypothetical protein